MLFSNSAIWGRHRQLDDSLVGQLTNTDLEMGHEDGGVLHDGSHGDQISPNMLFK